MHMWGLTANWCVIHCIAMQRNAQGNTMQSNTRQYKATRRYSEMQCSAMQGSTTHWRPTFNLDANGQWERGITFIIIVVIIIIINVIVINQFVKIFFSLNIDKYMQKNSNYSFSKKEEDPL